MTAKQSANYYQFSRMELKNKMNSSRVRKRSRMTPHQRRRDMALLPFLLLLTPAVAFLRNRNPGKTQSRLRKPIRWWPTRNKQGKLYCMKSNTYPDEFLKNDLLLYDSEEECCSTHSCDDITSTSTTEEPSTKAAATEVNNDVDNQDSTTEATRVATTTEATATTAVSIERNDSSSTAKAPGSNCPESKWHISTVIGGLNTCTNDDKYPAVWEGTDYLLDSASECCDFFFAFADECIINDVCEHRNDNNCPEMKWHISTISGGANTCSNDSIYPSEWEGIKDTHFFASAKECCDRFFPSNCRVADHCGCSTNWHMSIMPGEKNTCTNDENYPTGWLGQPHRHFFMTAEECCQENFDDEDCNVKNTCSKCLETWHVNPENPGSSW